MTKSKEEDMDYNFDELSFKEHFLIMKSLRPEERVRVSLTSNGASHQAALFLNDFHGFELYGFSDNHWRIYAVRSPYETQKERKDGFILDIKHNKGTSVMGCLDMDNNELWRKTDDAPFDVLKFVTNYFKIMLVANMDSIKKLVICGYKLCDFDFGVRSMKCLESLEIGGDVDIHQFLPKLENPLKNLVVRCRTTEIPLATYKQIYRVSQSLHLTYARLTYQQFRELCAPRVSFAIGCLTPEDIFRFINSFKEVDFYEQFGEYQWNIDYSDFDLKELLRLLKISEKESKQEKIEIKQVSYPRKSGELSVTESTIKFAWDMRTEPMECGKEKKKVSE